MLSILKNIGLSEKEIKLYEELYKHGEETITQLSKNTGITRSYCYEIVEKLSTKGLITKTIVNNRCFWKALPKEKLLGYIDFIKEDIDKELTKVSMNQKDDEEREINLYKGKKGIRLLLDKISESKTKVVGFGASKNLKKYLPFYSKHFLKKIEKKKIPFDLLCLKGDKPASIFEGIRYKQFKDRFKTCAEINVYEDKTIIFLWKDKLEAIEIVDKDVANSFRNYHKVFWENL